MLAHAGQQRLTQTEVVQHRRAQIVGDLAHAADGLPHLATQHLQLFLGRIRIAAHQLPGDAQLQVQSNQL